MSVAVLGGGAFGTALAISIAQVRPVILWARNAQDWTDRQSPRLPDAPVPDAVALTGDLKRAIGADTLLFAVPMQSLSGLLAAIPETLQGKALVACCKGIDLRTGQGPAHRLAETKPEATAAILTGPSFATDIARGLPTALTLACADDTVGQALQTELSTPNLRLYRSTDVAGAELGGALKNVIAIASGACMGAGLGDSARAALMTRGFAEMMRLALHFGARTETLAGLSGLGDLALTCTSPLSRNFRFGEALGRGDTPDATMTVEGKATARAALDIAERAGLSLPITTAVHAISTGQTSVADAIQGLLARPLKEE
ncbi:NAD(P)-dependent glycerol-3-phosphate dehydrogenase [Thalassococcus sp. CAU 1522]|uniref:Glycerol-3-phosphate dehydrogenase [NAD(P)+] n=1 Tax=Thalassococcus arenae TaxID=2851652 RepID=A0ABS6N774_9RHOB|nr:NAD(P)H-dependent glycerol-3-phosphate dehydrogenase [Thalassococcus arenae]MBV2359522.1 NAD(P)-dependent glycerol-3-phosphate dehydrogenase [Thalassococcus arenae]